MTETEIKHLAENWIAYWHADHDSPEREALSWVGDREWDLVNEEPLLAWELVLSVLKLNSSNKIQQVLSAGPLEDLLAKHGSVIIDLVETEAKTNSMFAQLLGGVWKNSMSEDVWVRVQAVWDRGGWDGIPKT